MSLCEICQAPTEQGCNECKTTYYCCASCQQNDWPQHQQHCEALIGLATFESMTKGHPAFQTRLTGTAKGIVVFAQLGKAIALRLVQTLMHDNPPFKLIPFRHSVMPQLHSAYYEAAIYWAEWFGRSRILKHKHALNFARTMEDAVDVYFHLGWESLFILLEKGILEGHETITPPAGFTLSQGEKREAQTKLDDVRNTPIYPDIFEPMLRNVTRQGDVAEVTATAWEDYISRNLQIAFFHLKHYAHAHATPAPELTKKYVYLLISSFRLLGESLFTASGVETS